MRIMLISLGDETGHPAVTCGLQSGTVSRAQALGLTWVRAA